MSKLLRPDTSKVPLWRRPATRLEHPITAWRIWQTVYRDGWALSSVAVDCIWEGPVIRAHKRPVDPALWDKNRDEMSEVFSVAGIHALKTREQALAALRPYAANVYGTVHLWGRVAQFELGYRAEVCMVKRLWLIASDVVYNIRDESLGTENAQGPTNKVIHDLSHRYDCEVELVYDRR